MSTPAQPATPEGTTDPGTQPDNPTAPPAAPTPPEPAAPANTEPSEPNQPEPKAKAPKFEGDFDPARFEKLVENLRGDVAAEKAKREALEQKAKDDQDTLMKRVATAFGLETDEAKPPTLEDLAKQLEESRGETKESRAQARQTQVELAVYKTAQKHGGDPDALLDSRSFANAIEKLDPSAADFDEQVGKAVKTAVDSNKKLAAKAPKQEPEPTPAGGAPMDGAGNGKRQLGAADVKRMTPAEITKAVQEGRLNAYLGSG
ncbi:hypothetical protein [Streptomyces sp. NPDC006863]|uniref:hypothetical protein n=1 Tax=Streptomyces sp. NPDC006863 TaxID=3154779 RepID=UPI0033EF51DC